jgi:hypothetical protein
MRSTASVVAVLQALEPLDRRRCPGLFVDPCPTPTTINELLRMPFLGLAQARKHHGFMLDER